MAFVRSLESLNKLLLGIASWGLMIGMITISSVVPYAVFGRYVLGNSPIWASEVNIFSLVWISMLGAAIGLPKGYQIGMTFVIEYLPDTIRRFVILIAHLIMLGFLGVLIVIGIKQSIYNMNQISPALELSMSIPYMAIPLGATLMWLSTLEKAIHDLISNKADDVAEHIGESA